MGSQCPHLGFGQRSNRTALVRLFFFRGFGISRQYVLVFAIVLQVFAIIDKSLMLGVMGILVSRGFHQRRILLAGNGSIL